MIVGVPGGRRRAALGIAAVTAVVVVATAGCGGGSAAGEPLAPVASSTAGSSASAGGSGSATGSGGATAGGTPDGAERPRVLVGVQGDAGEQGTGALVVLDPATGVVRRTLDPKLVVGDAVALGADRSTVYYEKAIGCPHEIWTVPVAGGTPSRLVAGGRPALSPDGARLAYTTEVRGDDCAADAGYGKTYSVSVRTLATGATTRLPLSPEQLVIPSPVDHLSWSPDGARLAVSISSAQDNEGWGLNLVDPAKDRYYLGEKSAGSIVPVPARARGTRDFFREGVYLPGGGLFVVRRCCDGWEPVTSSEVLEEIDPVTGATRHHIADGLLTKDHTSLDADPSGHWLLYLSGDQVMVSHDGARPTTLTSGYQAVDW